MKQTSVDAIRAALSALLQALETATIPMTGHWVYQRAASGNWQGSFVQRPDTFLLLAPYEGLIARLSQSLTPVLTADYPGHMTMIGVATVSSMLDGRMILGGLAHESFRRYGTFAITNEQLNELLAEAAGFFDRPNIRLRLAAPILNVHSSRDVPPISFPGGIIMRPLTDEEFTDFYGGNPIFRGTGRLLNFPDFVFVREIEVPKLIGVPPEAIPDPIWKPTQEILDRCMLALSSFKDGGPVGYDGVRVLPLELAFGVMAGAQQFWAHEHVPFGRYDLTPEEAPRLEAYARLFENIHQTLEMACQRLVDATRRTKARDSIVDAVIGLESMLLASVDEDQRGELSFRFSLNYASLFEVSQRRDAYQTARDLYRLRSRIAHGGVPSEKWKINREDMALGEIASLARTVLRETLARFIPHPAKPDFLEPGYWVSRALGL